MGSWRARRRKHRARRRRKGVVITALATLLGEHQAGRRRKGVVITALVALLVVVVLLNLQDEATKNYLNPGSGGESSLYSDQELAKFEPPNGYVYTGVVVDQKREDTTEVAEQKWDEWSSLMDGNTPNISHTFEEFDTWFGYDFDIAKARGAVPLISWQTGNAASPATIANAGDTSKGRPTDEIILLNAKLSADYAEPVFLRVDHEMNAHWFPWSAYNEDGSQRSFSAKDFQDMWRRMVVIFRGGKVADVNQRLADLGLPPLDPDVSLSDSMDIPSASDPEGYLEPAENVAFVFNPVDAPGIPDTEGNRWLDYWPGDSYVDWVGQSNYNTTWNATMEQKFEWLEAFYQEFSIRRGKPYMMGEWGLEPKKNGGFGDNPAYIKDMLWWTQKHPKVKALVFFSINSKGGDRSLSSYPDSAQALAAGLSQPRFLDSGRFLNTQ